MWVQVKEREATVILQGDDRARPMVSSAAVPFEDTNSVHTVNTEYTESSARGVDTLHDKREMQVQEDGKGAIHIDPKLPASEVYMVRVAFGGGGADAGRAVDLRLLVTHDRLDRLRFMEVFCDSRALEAALA